MSEFIESMYQCMYVFITREREGVKGCMRGVMKGGESGE